MFVPRRLKNPRMRIMSLPSNWVPVIDESDVVVTSDGMDDDVHVQSL
jgi:hypothetical protein